MEKTVKTFKHFSEKGYKHYTENTIEELDELPLDNHHIITEFAHLCEWLRVNHGIFIQIFPAGDNGKMVFYCKIIKNDKGWVKIIHQISKWVDSPEESYSAAFDYIRQSNII